VDSRKVYKEADLMKRKLEILALILKENSNHDIANKLPPSLRPIETHKHPVMEKTGSKNITGLVKFAIRNKLFDDLFY
jgi:DNA-binding NarL/FixJ family response regulator